MNHQSQFARPPLRADAIGRTAKLPPLGRPATFNHDQMYDGRRAGARSLWGCDRHAPVRVNLFRGQGLPELGRGLVARGPFGLRGCVNTRLAKVSHSQASGVFQDLTDLPEFHSSSSSVRRRLDSHDANEKGLTHAQILFAPGAKADD